MHDKIKIRIRGLRKSGLTRAEIEDAVKNKTLYFNDLTCKHWFFDFKIKDKWVELVKINNELNDATVNIYS